MKKIGSGNTAEVFEYEDKKICKLYHKKFSREVVKIEYENMVLVNKLNVPSPKGYELVEFDGRFGIIEERLYGGTILNLMMHGKDVEGLVVQMADLHKKILNCHTTECVSYKDELRGFIKGKLSPNDNLYSEIEKLPDGDCLCHGDFHPDNVWRNGDGKVLVIDFMNVCYGPKEFDIARSFFLMTQGSLPNDLNDDEKLAITKMRSALGEAYLNLMGVSFKDIEIFFNVVAACRSYELA